MSDPYETPSRDELAREVLDAEEYGQYRNDIAERARLRALARKHRNERMRATDVWGDWNEGA